MAGSFGPASRVPMKQLTYWGPGALGDDMEIGYADPILIMGRWTEQRTELQGSNGEQIVSKTVVIVDRDLETGGYLAQGNHLSAPNPTGLEAAEEIQGFTSTPDMRFAEQLRRAYL